MACDEGLPASPSDVAGVIPDQAALPLVATKSRIVAGASLATFDAEIVAGLSIETVRLWASLPRMQIAVRNDSGVPYRMIAVESMRQWHSLIQWFQDNRFGDELSGRCFSRNKFDAIFRKLV